jgi:hypothetical protein
VLKLEGRTILQGNSQIKQWDDISSHILEPSKSIHFNNFTFYLHSVGIEIRIRTETVLVQMDAFNTFPNRLQSHLLLPMVVKYDQEGAFSVSLVGAAYIP